MSKGKTRLGLVGLCVTAAMALMAFAASGAQAKAWMVEGTTVTSDLTVEIVVLKDVHVLLLTTYGTNSPLWILCNDEKIKVPTALLEANGVAKGEVTFEECQAYLKEGGEMKVSPACKPAEPIKAGGTLTIEGTGTSAEIKAEGTGGKFTTVTLGKEEECAAGENFEVTGVLFAKDCKKDPETELLEHLIEEDATKSTLKFGGHTATLDGSVIIHVFEKGVMKKFSLLG